MSPNNLIHFNKELENSYDELKNYMHKLATADYESIRKTIDEAKKKLSPTAFAMYSDLVNSYYTPLTAYVVAKISNEQYDYMDMLDRIFSTLSRFDKEKQEYIMLKAFDAFASHSPEGSKLAEMLSCITHYKIDMVAYLLEVFRLIEPYIVQAAREALHNVNDSGVKEYLGAYEAMIKMSLHAAEQNIHEARKLLEQEQKKKDEQTQTQNGESCQKNTENTQT